MPSPTEQHRIESFLASPSRARWLSSTMVIVDDDPSVRKSLARLLSVEGFGGVKTFGSAREFLDWPAPEQCVLILDIQMPGMTGLDLQEALRAAGRRHPIIFITGFVDTPAVVRAMRGGAVDVLQKPLDLTALLDAITRAGGGP